MALLEISNKVKIFSKIEVLPVKKISYIYLQFFIPKNSRVLPQRQNEVCYRINIFTMIASSFESFYSSTLGRNVHLINFYLYI